MHLINELFCTVLWGVMSPHLTWIFVFHWPFLWSLLWAMHTGSAQWGSAAVPWGWCQILVIVPGSSTAATATPRGIGRYAILRSAAFYSSAQVFFCTSWWQMIAECLGYWYHLTMPSCVASSRWIALHSHGALSSGCHLCGCRPRPPISFSYGMDQNIFWNNVWKKWIKITLKK